MLRQIVTPHNHSLTVMDRNEGFSGSSKNPRVERTASEYCTARSHGRDFAMMADRFVDGATTFA